MGNRTPSSPKSEQAVLRLECIIYGSKRIVGDGILGASQH